MADLGYSIAPNILLDIGCHDCDMDDFSGGPADRLTARRLTGDEIRVGFRYPLDQPPHRRKWPALL